MNGHHHKYFSVGIAFCSNYVAMWEEPMILGVVGAGFGHGQDVWGRWFSCGVTQCGKALISIFQQFSGSI